MATHIPDIPAQSPLRAISITIANGAALSGSIDLTGLTIVAIQMPAAWTAANITFQASTTDGGTLQDVYDDAGTEVTVTAAASRFITLSPATSIAYRFLKLRSGTTGTPVNQGGERSITLIVREF